MWNHVGVGVVLELEYIMKGDLYTCQNKYEYLLSQPKGKGIYRNRVGHKDGSVDSQSPRKYVIIQLPAL